MHTYAYTWNGRHKQKAVTRCRSMGMLWASCLAGGSACHVSRSYTMLLGFCNYSYICMGCVYALASLTTTRGHCMCQYQPLEGKQRYIAALCRMNTIIHVRFQYPMNTHSWSKISWCSWCSYLLIYSSIKRFCCHANRLIQSCKILATLSGL